MRINPYFFRAENGSYLSDDQIRQYAPSVFTQMKFPGMSDGYHPVPTNDILDSIRNIGFQPVQVSQSGDPNSVKSLFAKHVVRFRKIDDLDLERGDIVPEVLLRNAHDGTSSYSLTAGLFRVVCLNGLVVGNGELFRIIVRHVGGNDLIPRVLDGTKRIADQVPALLKRVDGLKEKILDQEQRLQFALKAWKIAPSQLTVDPSNLLSPRRGPDMGYDAWTVMNVIQENLIRGGVEGLDRRGSVRRTSSIRDVDRDTVVNRALWDLAEAA